MLAPNDTSSRNAPDQASWDGGVARLWRHAPLQEFPHWLVSIGETSDIPGGRLRTLYFEYCEFADVEPLTAGRLHRQLSAAGVSRYREGTGKRRWLYRVRLLRAVDRTNDRRLAA